MIRPFYSNAEYTQIFVRFKISALFAFLLVIFGCRYASRSINAGKEKDPEQGVSRVLFPERPKANGI